MRISDWSSDVCSSDLDVAQEGFGGIPPPAAALVHFKVAHTKIIAAVEVVAGGYTRLLRRFRKCFQNFPTQALLFNAPFSLATVKLWQVCVGQDRKRVV